MPFKDPAAAKAYKRAKYLANKEEILAKNKAWRLANAEKVAASKAAWHLANKEHTTALRKKNREHIAMRQKAWRDANPDKIKAYKKRHYLKHKEAINARQKIARSTPEKKAYYKKKTAEFQKAHPDKCSQYRKKFYKKTYAANPEKYRIRQLNRRALKKGRGGKLPYGTLPKMLKAQDGLCNLCRVDITGGYHVDHVLALSKGGMNTVDNIQLLCAPCNLKKWAH